MSTDGSGRAPSVPRRFALYVVLRAVRPLPGAVPGGSGRPERAREAADALAALAGVDGLHTRGWYDVAGFRADADLMVWWWAQDPDALQRAYHVLLAGGVGQYFTPIWSAMGVHRPAEFARRHVPAFVRGREPGAYLCVYPFVRSADWYLLEPDTRAALLREHGQAARPYRDVAANTLAAFGLGDYEWILAFEADDVVRLVDLIRAMRATGARRHVRLETPFYTGKRRPLADILADLP